MKQQILFIAILSASSYLFGQFHAVHIPDDKIFQMKIDGDTADWDWMPEEYIISEKSMSYTFNKKPIENNSWQCRLRVGWSDKTNKIYINAKVIDNSIILTNPDHYMNDCLQFAINTNNKGGKFSDGQRSNHVIVGWIKLDTINKVVSNISVGPKWMQDELSNSYNWEAIKFMAGPNKYVIVYELCMNIYNEWEAGSAETSYMCLLIPDKKIKLTIILEDVDRLDNSRVEWTTKANYQWYMNADYFSEFILDPPLPAKGVTWQNIRYILDVE